nr:regulator of G-protein signaling 12-like isoform X3 [Petromyzon marinus]XP_032806096.1 regulator of G-protein signaling 12-like isoform X3 [Petromyzon marinus]
MDSALGQARPVGLAGHRREDLHTVELARGPLGYGFTVVARAPCLVNCVLPGGPADVAGLRAGDQIVAINDKDVSCASHHGVVALIGQSLHTLKLVMAQNCNKPYVLLNNEASPCKYRESFELDGVIKGAPIFHKMENNHSLMTDERLPPPHRAQSLVYPIVAVPHAGSGDGGRELPSRWEGTDDPDDSLSGDVDLLTVKLIVCYLGSVELPSFDMDAEVEVLSTIQSCLQRLRTKHRIHSLLLMKILQDCIQLYNEEHALIATYSADKLAFSVVCPYDRNVVGIVTIAHVDDTAGEGGALRMSCHVFFIDPTLSAHSCHVSVAQQFSFECTPDPDTNGCLEFGDSSQTLLQFVSVLYREMGEVIEKIRAVAFADVGHTELEAKRSVYSLNSDSGIGGFGMEVKDLPLDGNGGAVSTRETLLLDESVSLYTSSISVGSNYNRTPVGASFTALINSDTQGASRHNDVYLDKRHNTEDCSCSKDAGVAATGSPSIAEYNDTQEYCAGERALCVAAEVSCDHAVSASFPRDLPPPMMHIEMNKYKKPVAPQHSAQRNKYDRSSLTQQLSQTNEDLTRPSLSQPEDLESSGRLTDSISRALTRTGHNGPRFTQSADALDGTVASDGELDRGELNSSSSQQSVSSNASLPSALSVRRQQQLSYEGRVASWALSFERLLHDPLGLRYFTEFLKKEFSEENILFWLACEQFKQTAYHDKHTLREKAREIFHAFLSRRAPNPVNIDSHGQLCERMLQDPHAHMFLEQQQQIFSLMKFDSYARFLKSALYQHCLLAEVGGHPLPSLASPAVSPPASQLTANQASAAIPDQAGTDEDWCRVVLPDGHSATLHVRPRLSIRELLRPLCEQRGLPLAATDVFLLGGEKVFHFTWVQALPLVMEQESSSLAMREIRLEPRTLFRLDLVPINRSVGVKAKPTKAVTEVLKPIVTKYGMKLEDLVATMEGQSVPLDLGIAVSSLDGQRVVLDTRRQLRTQQGGDTTERGHTPPATAHVLASSPVQVRSGNEKKSYARHISTAKAIFGSGEKCDNSSKQTYISRKKKTGTKMDDVEELFEILVKAQSNRVNDQRGLLCKEDLILPDFLKANSAHHKHRYHQPAATNTFTSAAIHKRELHRNPLDHKTTEPGVNYAQRTNRATLEESGGSFIPANHRTHEYSRLESLPSQHKRPDPGYSERPRLGPTHSHNESNGAEGSWQPRAACVAVCARDGSATRHPSPSARPSAAHGKRTQSVRTRDPGKTLHPWETSHTRAEDYRAGTGEMETGHRGVANSRMRDDENGNEGAKRNLVAELDLASHATAMRLSKVANYTALLPNCNPHGGGVASRPSRAPPQSAPLHDHSATRNHKPPGRTDVLGTEKKPLYREALDVDSVDFAKPRGPPLSRKTQHGAQATDATRGTQASCSLEQVAHELTARKGRTRVPIYRHSGPAAAVAGDESLCRTRQETTLKASFV